MDIIRAEEIIKQFGKYKVLVIGDIFLDHYVHGVVERINPEAPVPILKVTEEREETGGAGNTAKNVAALGANATLISVVGHDDTADSMEARAREEGYEPVLIRDENRPSIKKTRHLVGNQHMLRVDYENAADLDQDIEEKVIIAIKEKMSEDFDAVIVSDYAKGAISQKVADTILDEAGQNDILVAGDVKPSRAGFFTGASFVAPNIKEAHEYIGLNHHEKQVPPDELVRMIFTKMCSNVYLTLGKDGMFVYCGGEHGTHIPQDNIIEVADESGAGDTSVVVLMLSRLAGAKELEAAEIANAGGAVVVGKVGSVGITQQEIKDMMDANCKHGK